MIRLLTPWPALLVEDEERILIAADFHLGIEYELAKMGISIPYQTDRYTKELIDLVDQHKPDRVILLGDIKHGVPVTSFQEKREIPRFFATLLDHVDYVDITRGNHDGNLQNLVPEEVKIHPSRGVIIGEKFKVAALHGHSWPYPKLLGADILIMGHNHPTVQLNTPLGVHITRRAWVRGTCDRELLASAVLKQEGHKTGMDPVDTIKKLYDVEMRELQIILTPTFNDLMGGLPINADTPKSLLGPLFRSKTVNPENMDVYLLDGTFLGTVEFLRTLA